MASTSREKSDVTDSDERSNNSWAHKLFGSICLLTVEPAIALIYFGLIISYFIFQNFILEKVCNIKLNYDSDICTAVLQHNHTNNITEDVAHEVEMETNKMFGWKFPLDHCIPILMALVVGPWSDKHGRKPLMLASAFGYTLAQSFLLINVWQWSWPIEAAVVSFNNYDLICLRLCFRCNIRTFRLATASSMAWAGPVLR